MSELGVIVLNLVLTFIAGYVADKMDRGNYE